jgi:hypothetical protein
MTRDQAKELGRENRRQVNRIYINSSRQVEKLEGKIMSSLFLSHEATVEKQVEK